MAGGPYDAGFTAPDIGPGAAFLAAVLNQNKANARADEYARMQKQAMAHSAERESAALARQKEQDDYHRSVERWQAMPALYRSAHTSVPGANLNPYGVKFSEGHDLPGNVEGPEQSPTAEAARFALHPTMPEAAHETMEPPFQLRPDEEGPEQFPDVEDDRFALAAQRREPPDSAFFSDSGGPASGPRASATDLLPETPESRMPLIQQAAINSSGMAPGPEGKRRVYAQVPGQQQFEVPEQSDHTPFGAEYDSIYRGLLDTGEDPHKAMQYMAAQYKADQAQGHIADRVASQIDARRDESLRSRADVAQQDEWRRLQREQSEKNSRIGASAARAGQGNKDEASVDRAMSLINQRAKAFRDISQYPKLVQADKTVREIFNNISTGSVNLQNRDAQIQMAKYFRGSIPTGAEMTHLYTNLGGTQDAWNRFVSHGIKGALTPEEIHQLRVSATAVRKEHEENKGRAVKVGRKLFGPGSALDNYPDQAQAQFDAHMEELGIDPASLPPLYQTEGGAAMGGFARPKVQPRGTKRTALDDLEAQIDALGAK